METSSSLVDRKGTTDTTAIGDAYHSSNGGASFNVSTTTAGWCWRYAAQLLVIPFPTLWFSIGGYGHTGSEMNDVRTRAA